MNPGTMCIRMQSLAKRTWRLLLAAAAASSCSVNPTFESSLQENDPFDELSEIAAVTCTADPIRFELARCQGESPFCGSQTPAQVELSLHCTETSGIGAYAEGIVAELIGPKGQTLPLAWSRALASPVRIEASGAATVTTKLILTPSSAQTWDSATTEYNDNGGKQNDLDGAASGYLAVIVVGTDDNGQNLAVYPPLFVSTELSAGYSPSGQSKSCNPGQTPCPSGECIKLSQVCDGKDNCSDGSDEWSCSKPSSCKDWEFQCDNGGCIDQEWRCDGIPDCSDGSDEECW